MALFGRNFNKPGPGVSKNEKKKNAFFRYFQLLFRKLTKLCQVNLIFCVPFIIALALFFVIAIYVNNIFLSWLPFAFLSPFLAGLTFVTRNFAREEHAFVWGDFKDAVKENWKPFLIHGVITYVVVCLMYVALSFYRGQQENSILFGIAFVICLSICLIFLFMQYYIPLMIVTFDLKLKNVYKNAAIFAVVGLGRNLIATLFLAVLFFLALLMLQSVPSLFIGIILVFLILFALISYSINFIVYPNIEKFLIKPYYEKQQAAEEAALEEPTSGEEKDSVFRNMDVTDLEDDDAEKEEKPAQKKTEYVYENGRLVRKSEVEPLFSDDKTAKERNQLNKR